MANFDAPTRAAHVAAFEQFNRLFTQRLRLLDEPGLNSKLSFPEARILAELAGGTSRSGAELARTLQLNAGYISRLLARMHRHELLLRTLSATDGRRREYSLSTRGQGALEELQQATRARIGALLDDLSATNEGELMRAIDVFQRSLIGAASTPSPIVLRGHEPGDMGWVVQRHAQLYQREYGWDASFEALCARIAAEFIEKFDPATEYCWIAEHGEQRLGSALVVNAGDTKAQIRLVLVEPQARGSGLGRRLIRECIRFASRKNYQSITLWTNSNLHAARHIYAGEGFELLSREAHHSFGHDLVGEHWQRPLP